MPSLTNAPAFAAAQQTSRMIGRENKLNLLEKAVCKKGRDTRVEVISGWGGLGKTRLLSEAGWHAGNPNIFPHRKPPSPEYVWQNKDSNITIIASDILDFTDLHLHIFEDFMERIRKALGWHADAGFTKFEDVHNDYLLSRTNQADFLSAKKAAEKMREAFFSDYAAIAQNHRIVLLLDTAEQLNYAGPDWLQPLLEPDDRQSGTRDHLKNLLIQGQLPNTTLLLAGRPSVDAYFDELQKAAEKNDTFSLERFELNTFEEKNTKTYLEQLAVDYRTYRDAQANSSAYFDSDIAANLQDLVDDPQQIDVLHHYTGGKPVLLALFTDVWAEGARIPEFLLDTPVEAEDRIQKIMAQLRSEHPKLSPDKLEKEALKQLQSEIEAAFIRLIFAKPGDIRAQILTALARAKRGLDIAQLEFILGHKPGQKYDKAWQADNPILRKEIEREFDRTNPQALVNLSFVKRGPYGRLILQDELYRIYDRHMAANDQSRQSETSARSDLFTQLLNITETKRDDLKAKRRFYHAEDEKQVRLETPGNALAAEYPYPSIYEKRKRIGIEDRLFEAEIERLHYKLRLAPDEGLNDFYLDLAEQYGRAGDLAYDMLTQVEVWRFVQYNSDEEHWRDLVALPEDITWEALERTAAANEATNWIKRFWVQKKFTRAIEFAVKLEAENLEQEPIPDLSQLMQDVLEHPFFAAERTAWKELCETYLGQDVEETITTLRKTVQAPERLLKEDFPDCRTYGLRPDTAHNRLKRIIGYIYNSLGYSLTTLGRYREANKAYVTGLRHLRDTGFLTMEAVIRNNNARVLSELGRTTRALRICRDGLNLRETLGYENPIAGSHSTLALIYNNGMQPENAWREAALARIHFLKLADPRGLGLALYHLAEALRRLGHARRENERLAQKLFDSARAAITKSVALFDELQEPLRRVESTIELGCLYRDYTVFIRAVLEKQAASSDLQDILRDNQNNALSTLKRAVDMAKEHQYPRHKLDAQVNLAWTYYYGSNADAAEQAIEDSITMAEEITKHLAGQVETYKPHCQIEPGKLPPQPDDTEPYIFLLLSKAFTVQARLRMDQFKKYRDELKKQNEDREKAEITELVHDNKEAQSYMKAAVESFLLALAYNKLYSPRSPYISVLFDRLYDYLKKFNAIELEDFYTHQANLTHQPQASEAPAPSKESITGYGIKLIKPDDLADMDIFLRESFGDFLPAKKQKAGSQEAGK